MLQLGNSVWVYHFLHCSSNFGNCYCIKVKLFITLMTDIRILLKEGTDFVYENTLISHLKVKKGILNSWNVRRQDDKLLWIWNKQEFGGEEQERGEEWVSLELNIVWQGIEILAVQMVEWLLQSEYLNLHFWFACVVALQIPWPPKFAVKLFHI